MTKNLRRIIPTEHQIQAAIVEWANAQYFDSSYAKSFYGDSGAIHRRIGDFLIKIPNEGKRTLPYAIRMRKEGLRKGAADMFLAVTTGDYGRSVPGLWIEVKSRKGRLSPYQSIFMADMIMNRYAYCIVKSVDEGIQAIKDYLGMTN